MTESEWREIRLDSCYHEAAHAVLCHRAGFAIRYVSVETPARPELLDITMSQTTMAPWQAVQVATGLFAAEMAVYRRHGRERPARTFEDWLRECRDLEELALEGDDEGSNCDDMQALQVLRHAVDSGYLPSVEVGYHEAQELAAIDLDHHWPAIVAVARALEEQGRLSGADCVAIIAGAE